MKRFLAWAVGLPVAIVLVAFAIANRQFVRVSLDPLAPDDPWLSLELPLWALLFAGIFCGLVTGWMVAWFRQRRWRKAAREARHELERVRARNEKLERAERQGQLTAVDG